jgi:hypothetical protein
LRAQSTTSNHNAKLPTLDSFDVRPTSSIRQNKKQSKQFTIAWVLIEHLPGHRPMGNQNVFAFI